MVICEVDGDFNFTSSLFFFLSIHTCLDSMSPFSLSLIFLNSYLSSWYYEFIYWLDHFLYYSIDIKGCLSRSFYSNPVDVNILCFFILDYLHCLEAYIDGSCRLEQDEDYFKEIFNWFIDLVFFTYFYVFVQRILCCLLGLNW